MYAWRHLLREIMDLKDCEEICWWSGGGKHFRGQVPLATMICNGIEQLCTKSGLRYNFEVGINYGVPAHFKNACDGAQAHAKAALSEMSKKEVISSLEEYVERAQRLYADFQDRPGATTRMPARFHLFWPREQKSKFIADYCKQVTAASYKEQIGVCRSWSGRLNDTRRIGRPLFADKNRVLTAINFSARMLASQKLNKERACLPTLCDIPAAAADPADPAEADPECDEEIAAAAAELCPAGELAVPAGEKMMDGWLCSYRKSEPEKAAFSKWRARYSRMRVKWWSSGVGLQLPQARRPVADQLALQRPWRERRKAAMVAR